MYAVKGAPVSGAPFLFRQHLPGILLYCCAVQAAVAGNCAAGHTSERVQVVYVYDGDTVKLEDGRRLRFIGINTPETGHHNQATQPYANEAKARLQELLDTNNRTLLLQAGREQRDHYGRLLAHAFLENGDNIAVRLLQKGLATTLVVPPNTWGQPCYQQHEDEARSAGRGIWELDAYKPRPSQSLPPGTRGFRIVHGKVQAVRKSPHNVWVNMEGTLVIRINKRDFVNFEPGFLESLEGHRIETRGWVKPVKSGLQINVQHPAALTRAARPENTR